eukprot:CAMPEP_0195523714 /NCGR_PEP_ID=MMETSP0794_2-20130614/23061_1 /TAXON_ID=515487 /ORGANISM="Stephanopyxis turris, Strain CCMP 815" /LENGTH=220 /DNA_ID=CAMNT_0040653769 /DNA_START=14 /DNA_END=676 /DNA_ORIENTATION=-
MKILMENFLQNLEQPRSTREEKISPSATDTAQSNNEGISLNTPADIAKIEPLLFFDIRRAKVSQTYIPIKLGLSFNELARLSEKSTAKLGGMLGRNNSERYILTTGYDGRWAKRRRTILIGIFSDATPKQIAKAYFHALLLARLLKVGGISKSRARKGKKSTSIEEPTMEEVESKASDSFHELWSCFERNAESSGWDLSNTVLQTEGYAIEVRRDGNDMK